MTKRFIDGYRDRLTGGCKDCAAYMEVVTPVGHETTVTIFHDETCPCPTEQRISSDERAIFHAVKPDVIPHWPEQ